MDSQPPPDNQRQSFRCRMSGQEQPAVLRLGRACYAAWVLDESAGGFAIALDGLSLEALGKAAVGSKAVLQTAAGACFEVQLVNLAEMPPQRGQPNAAPPRLRVGLKRLCEAPSPDLAYRGASLLARLTAIVAPRQSPMIGSFLMIGVLFAGVAVAAMLWSAYPQWRPNFRLTAPRNYFQFQPAASNASSPRQSQALPAPSTVTAPSRLGYEQPLAAAKSPASGPSSPGPAQADAAAQPLGKLLTHLRGAGVLAVPEVIRALQLTDSQQAEIYRIDKAAAETLQKMPASAGAERREDQVLRDARRQAFGVLSEGQRAQWERLVDDASKN